MKEKSIVQKISNVIIFILILTVLVLKLVINFEIDHVFFISSVVLLIVISNISVLKEMTIFGNTIKLKETIKDAEETLYDVKSLAILFSKIIIHNFAWQNRYGKDEEAKNKYVHELIKYLRELNIKDIEIDKITKIYYDFVKYDYCTQLVEIIRKTYFNKIDKDIENEVKDIIDKEKNLSNPCTPEDVEMAMNILQPIKFDGLDIRNIELISKGIKDYKEFILKGIIERNGFFVELSKLQRGYYT